VVEISTKVTNNVLHITLRNSGQIKENIEEDTGFGLKNTIQRLQLLYRDTASLKISNENENTVLTELRIPKQLID
jgi:LytS/YehU family sensor histidine kinase